MTGQSDSTRADRLAAAYQETRPDLVDYLTRLVTRPDVAEELAQEAALRLIRLPGPGLEDLVAVRPWLFRVGSNLALDHLRRHSTWREDALVGIRRRADRDQGFQAESRLMVGSPEMAYIAREHLSVCLSCTLRNLPPQHAAAVLLVEVFDHSISQAAFALDATTGQAKNWLQAGREQLRAIYASTCALVTKGGVCYQCVELAEFFNHRATDPLEGSARDIDARFAAARASRAAPMGRWHRMMLRLIDDLLEA